MNSYNQYTEARVIADAIEKEGFSKEAEAVRTAISTGVSGTEIFVQLRYYLLPLADDGRVDPLTRSHIQDLIANINDALAR